MPRDIPGNALSHSALRRQGLWGQTRSRRRRGFMTTSVFQLTGGMKGDGVVRSTEYRRKASMTTTGRRNGARDHPIQCVLYSDRAVARLGRRSLKRPEQRQTPGFSEGRGELRFGSRSNRCPLAAVPGERNQDPPSRCGVHGRRQAEEAEKGVRRNTNCRSQKRLGS